MPRRVIFAGLAAGVAMFFWMSLAHMAISPLATAGISQLTTNETAVLDTLRTNLGTSSGMYVFPSMNLNRPQADAMKDYDAKLVSNPSGILIYHPPGAKSLTPGQLTSEFLAEMIEAMLAIWLLSKTNITSIGGRIGFVALTGLLASMPTNLSYWIWYGFPSAYTSAEMVTQIIAFTIAGTVAAFILRRRAT